MKQKQPILIALFLASFSLSATAQEAMVASGKSVTDTGGSVSYSVGQVVYSVRSGANGEITQGVQQPYEISTLGIDEHPEMSLQFSVHPNPTSDILLLSITNFSSSGLSYSLFDMNGRVIESKKILESQTSIDMKSQQSAIYFVKITDKNKEIKTFKIIKK